MQLKASTKLSIRYVQNLLAADEARLVVVCFYKRHPIHVTAQGLKI